MFASKFLHNLVSVCGINENHDATLPCAEFIRALSTETECVG